MENANYVCQCCGMPLDDSTFCTELNGDVNKDYCKYCYHDGEFTYTDINDLIEFCVNNFSTDEYPGEQMKAYMLQSLPELKYWKNKV